jgi:hypothetical protein
VTVHALSSFMMFPASNAHACIVPAAPLPRRQTRAESTWSLRHRSIVTVNHGGVIGLQPRVFFQFSQTKYQLRKKTGRAISVSAWICSRSTDSFGGRRSPDRRGHRQAACTMLPLSRKHAEPAVERPVGGIVPGRLTQRRLLHGSQARAICKDRRSTATH